MKSTMLPSQQLGSREELVNKSIGSVIAEMSSQQVCNQCISSFGYGEIQAKFVFPNIGDK